MLRLNRLTNIELQPEQLDQAATALQLLKKHLPPSVVQLFAVPKAVAKEAHTLDWLSVQTGHIQHYDTLNEVEQKRLLHQFNLRADSIRSLHHYLQERGNTTEAEQLAPFIVAPNPSYLYSVDGQPVLTNWITSPSLAHASPSPVHASTPPVLPAAALTSTVAVETTRRRLWPWLVLLLLLLLGGVFGWFLKKETGAPSPDLPFANNYACAAKKTTPPEFSIVFDTSRSMGLNIGISKADEDWFFGPNSGSLRSVRALNMVTGPSRLEVGKKAIHNMVSSLHPDISTRLLTFNSCGRIADHGLFSPTKRDFLLQTIDKLHTYDGTPSAKALQIAASQMNGVTEDAMIVLIIDGEDGCGMNICAVADHIATHQPRLRVNVVDVSGFGLSNCVAEKTRGRIYSSNDVSKINQIFRESIEEVAADSNC